MLNRVVERYLATLLMAMRGISSMSVRLFAMPCVRVTGSDSSGNKIVQSSVGRDTSISPLPSLHSGSRFAELRIFRRSQSTKNRFTPEELLVPAPVELF